MFVSTVVRRFALLGALVLPLCGAPAQADQGIPFGGCHPLPSGWSMLHAVVQFPSAYGGYGEWVNNAELLPVGENLRRFVKNHSGGNYVQPAFGSDSQVHTTLCAPAGHTYWLIVDSGQAKVAIGRVTMVRPGMMYRVRLTAPPLKR